MKKFASVIIGMFWMLTSNAQAFPTKERLEQLKALALSVQVADFKNIKFIDDESIPAPAGAGRIEADYVIKLNRKILNTLSFEGNNLIIYHEIGHIYLGHPDMSSVYKNENRSLVETEADAFAAFLYQRLHNLNQPLFDFISILGKKTQTVPPGPERERLFLDIFQLAK